MAAKELYVNLILIGLFAFSMISFTSLIGTENGSNVTLTDDPRVNSAFGSLGGNLTNLQRQAIGNKDSLEQDEPETGDGNLLFTSITAIWKVISGGITSMYNLLFGLIFDVFLGKSFIAVYSAIGAIITGLVIFSGWRLFRTGA